MRQPTLPSISRSIRRFNSTEYSIGNCLPGEVVDEAVDRQAHRLPLGEPALEHVEDLLLGHLGDAGLVLHRMAVAADGDRRVGVGAARAVDQERVALGVVLAALEVPRDVDDAAVGAAALPDGDRFRDDVGRGLVGRVDHLGAGVLVLAVVREGDREHLSAARRLAALQDDAGVLHRQPAADVAVNPPDFRLLVRQTALRHQVEDVGRPSSGRW